MPRRRYLENCLNCTRDAGKGNGAFEECPHGDFIRRIERNAGGAAGFGRLVGQAKTGKSCKIRRFEAQLPQRRHVKGQLARNPLGKAQGVQDRAAAYR